MKIIGTTGGGYLLDATCEEVALLSGGQLPAADQYGNSRVYGAGATFAVAPVVKHMHALSAKAENARQGAAFLRGLAEILDKGIPDWIAEPQPESEAEIERREMAASIPGRLLRSLREVTTDLSVAKPDGFDETGITRAKRTIELAVSYGVKDHRDE